MSKTSNLQKLHVLKIWLESLKTKRPRPVTSKTNQADEQD